MDTAQEVQQPPEPPKVSTVEDFVPDMGLDNKFLEDPAESKIKKAKAFFTQKKAAPKPQDETPRNELDSDRWVIL